jgi:hypothetical protein
MDPIDILAVISFTESDAFELLIAALGAEIVAALPAIAEGIANAALVCFAPSLIRRDRSN